MRGVGGLRAKRERVRGISIANSRKPPAHSACAPSEEVAHGERHARPRHHPACSARQTPRQIPEHASRRVCARGDRTRARRQARRALGETGHRDRTLEGAPCRRRLAAAENGHEKNSRQRTACPCSRQELDEEIAFREALARHEERAAPRRTFGGIAHSAFQAGDFRGAQAQRLESVGCGAQGCSDASAPIEVTGVVADSC